MSLWAWKGGDNDYWKHLEGLDRRKTSLSDHLLEVFREWRSSFAGIIACFERLFEQFEIMVSLTYIENTELSELEKVLAVRSDYKWVPVGRSGSDASVGDQLLSEILSGELKKSLLEAGFGNGGAEFLEKAVENYRRMAVRM